jgi:ribosomal protein L7/L12
MATAKRNTTTQTRDPAPELEQRGEVCVQLTAYPPRRKVATIEALMEHAGLGMNEAKEWLKDCAISHNTIIATGLSLEKAQAIVARLEEVGATANLCDMDGNKVGADEAAASTKLPALAELAARLRAQIALIACVQCHVREAGDGTAEEALEPIHDALEKIGEDLARWAEGGAS